MGEIRLWNYSSSGPQWGEKALKAYRIAGVRQSRTCVCNVQRGYSLPAHTSRYHAQRLPHNLMPLIRHQKTPRSLLTPQTLLSMFDNPPQLLGRHQYLPQDSIHHSLARVQASHACNRFLVFEHKLQHRLEHLPALGEGRLRPLYLRFCGFGDCAVDGGGSGGIDAAEDFAGRRGVALDERRARDLERVNCAPPT
jgi:hypothetical protein